MISLNAARRPDAVAMIAPLVERSPWVAESVVDCRPFRSDGDLAQALVECILAAGHARRLVLFNVHPELAGREAAEGRMTTESTGEQGRLGLLSLNPGDMGRLGRLNAAYRARFGHPFIIALHRVPDLAALFATFERRMDGTPLEEHVTTLAEVASVIRSRTSALFGPDAGAPVVDCEVASPA